MMRPEIKNELKEYKLIDKVDPSADFYLGKPNKCLVEEGSINKNALTKCKNLLENDPQLNIHLSRYALLLMKDGGQNLEVFADKMSSLHKTPQNKKQMEDFWIEAHRILLGLKLFADNGIIHHDMKHQNIVYNPKTKRINFIDFGLMTTRKDIIKKATASNFRLALFHWSYPFEYKFINKNEYTEYAKKSTSEKSKWFMNLIISITIDPDEKITEAFRTLYSTIYYNKPYWPIREGKDFSSDYFLQQYSKTMAHQVKPGEENYKKFYEKSIDTIDSYGVGMGFLYVLKKTFHLIDSSIC